MRIPSRLFVFAAVALAPFAGVFACSATSQPPVLGDYDGSKRDAVTGDVSLDAAAEAGDVDTDGGPCAPLALKGGFLTQNFVPQDAPIPQGGTLVDGTYYLAAANHYTGPGGQSGPSTLELQETFVVAGPSLVVTVIASGGSPTTESYTFTIVTPDGGVPSSVLDLTLVCSTNPQAITRSKLGFTIVGKQLALSSGVIENVLARP